MFWDFTNIKKLVQTFGRNLAYTTAWVDLQDEFNDF